MHQHEAQDLIYLRCGKSGWPRPWQTSSMETGGATPHDMLRRSEDVARQVWKRSPSFKAMGTGLTCMDHELGVDGAIDAVSPLRCGSSEAQKDCHDVL